MDFKGRFSIGMMAGECSPAVNHYLACTTTSWQGAYSDAPNQSACQVFAQDNSYFQWKSEETISSTLNDQPVRIFPTKFRSRSIPILELPKSLDPIHTAFRGILRGFESWLTT